MLRCFSKKIFHPPQKRHKRLMRNEIFATASILVELYKTEELKIKKIKNRLVWQNENNCLKIKF